MNSVDSLVTVDSVEAIVLLIRAYRINSVHSINRTDKIGNIRKWFNRT